MQNSSTAAMSVKDLMHELGVSKPVAFRLAQSDGFPSFRVGKRVLISREGFERWIADQTANKRAEA